MTSLTTKFSRFYEGLLSCIWNGPHKKFTLSVLLVDIWDELTCGLETVGLPLIRADLGFSYTQAGLLMTTGLLLAFFLEPLIFSYSDRGCKKKIAVAGMCSVALVSIAISTSHSYLMLLACFALYPTASGAAVTTSQAMLIDLHKDMPLKVMSRWTLMGAIGDLLSTIVIALGVFLGLHWYHLFQIVAVIWFFQAILIAIQEKPGIPLKSDASVSIEEKPSLWALFKETIKNPRFIRFAILLEIITLLDEILLGFGSLYVHDHLGFSATETSILMAVPMISCILSIFYVERCSLYLGSTRALQLASLLSIAGLALFLAAASQLAGIVIGLILLGWGAAMFYPIMKSEVYRLFEGQSGTVVAALGLFSPIGISLPYLLGMIADSAGLAVAIACTGIAPLAIILFACKDSSMTDLKEHKRNEET